MNLSAQQSVVERARTAHGLPADGEPVDAELCRVLLDQLLLLHDHLREKRQAVLLAELDAGNFGGGRPHQSRQRNESGDEFASVHGILPIVICCYAAAFFESRASCRSSAAACC